jgi:RNA polymerase sigma-70 factor (ECF subfamily)
VARLFAGFRARAEELRVTSLQPATINGQPGAVFFDPEGHPIVVVSLDIADDQVQAIRAVSNPDKLSHLHGLG